MFKQSHNLTHEDRGNTGSYPHSMNKKLYFFKGPSMKAQQGDSFWILLPKNKKGKFCLYNLLAYIVSGCICLVSAPIL